MHCVTHPNAVAQTPSIALSACPPRDMKYPLRLARPWHTNQEVQIEGGNLVQNLPPPAVSPLYDLNVLCAPPSPSSRPPNVLGPTFGQFQSLAGIFAFGANFAFFRVWQEVKKISPNAFVLKMFRIFLRFQISVENVDNFFFDPHPHRTPTHFGCLASPPRGANFFRKFFHPIVHNTLIILSYVCWGTSFLIRPQPGARPAP